MTQLVVISAARYKANGGGINYINPDFIDNGGDADIHLAADFTPAPTTLRNTVYYFNGQSPNPIDYSSALYVPPVDKATRHDLRQGQRQRHRHAHQARPGGHRRQRHRPRPPPAGPRVHHPRRQPDSAYESDTYYVTDLHLQHWDNIRISTRQQRPSTSNPPPQPDASDTSAGVLAWRAPRTVQG